MHFPKLLARLIEFLSHVHNFRALAAIHELQPLAFLAQCVDLVPTGIQWLTWSRQPDDSES
eukprot:765224-Hanusia_phi.AAC.4